MAGDAFGIPQRGLEEFDVRVAVCFPVDFTRVPEAHKPVYEQTFRDGIVPHYYKGSIVGTCSRCETDVFVGPRVQETVRRVSGVQIMCPVCAVMCRVEVGLAGVEVDTTMVDLGNVSGIPRTY